MLRVVTRRLKRQLELEALQQLVREVVQPQEQTCFQIEGVQPVQVPSNEPQQFVTT
jgi:hypothetical protein